MRSLLALTVTVAFWHFCFVGNCHVVSSYRFIVRQIYVHWWEKYIVDTSEYPKMISDCNLLDPQTGSIVGGSTIGILSLFGFSLSL
jgi:hypothetical protein